MLLTDTAGILLVAGKGGVGKTTVAASLAVSAARSGRRCLVVSTDPAHSLADVLDCSLSGEPTPVEHRLDAMEIDTEALADRHVREVARALKEFAHLDTWPEIDRQMALSRQSPGTVEAALTEHLADLLPLAGSDYDLVVFDTAPTGHTLRLLKLPGLLIGWTGQLLDQRHSHDQLAERAGADNSATERNRRIAKRLRTRQQRLERAHSLLTDSDLTRAVVVVTPERLPILESWRLVAELGDTGIAIAGLVVNGILPEVDDSAFLTRRRQRQKLHLQTIEQQFAALARVELALEADDPVGLPCLEAIGRRLWRGV